MRTVSVMLQDASVTVSTIWMRLRWVPSVWCVPVPVPVLVLVLVLNARGVLAFGAWTAQNP